MIAGLITLEDNNIHFSYDRESGNAKVLVSDNLTGQERETMMTFEQLGAFIGTSVCGTNEKVLTVCEEVLKGALPADWPRELKSSPIC